MRKMMLLSVAVLVCGALAIAQETPAGQTGSQSSTTTTQTTTTETSSGNAIQGCLTGTSGNYVLTDAAGVAYKLQGDESQFADNLNKQVEVMGTVGSSASASAGNTPDNSSEAGASQGEANANAGGASGTSTGANATANASKTLEVSSVKKIADTCGMNK